MYLKAMLVCDDVRFEINGTFTLVGVHDERLVVGPAQGAIAIPKLSFMTMVGGLTGVERIAFRHAVRPLDQASEPLVQPLREEGHDPNADEHNFVFDDSPLFLPGLGSYEHVTELEVNGERAIYRYRFHLEARR